jgi:hypothetical protein
VRICLDFDGTIVAQDRPYSDIVSPLEFLEGAKEGLLALKRAGHTLILWSGRASRSLLYDPNLDPLVRSGAVPCDRKSWLEARPLHWARWHAMVEFVEKELPGVFDAIDDGLAGKPSVDLFIDDRSMVMRGPATWSRIARAYGEEQPLYEQEAAVLDLLNRPVASLNLVPTGKLKAILDQVRGELRAAGIVHFEPTFALGDSGFWCADRAVTINLPWWLATEELSAAAQARYPHTWEDVARGVRHETGHALNYAFELWKREDWRKTFGDFTAPYPERPWPFVAGSPDFVEYVVDSGPGYGQRHADEDFAETFAAWLDPATGWRERYKAGARRKLEYVHLIARDVLTGWPTNHDIGVPKEWRASFPGQTVGQALAIPTAAAVVREPPGSAVASKAADFIEAQHPRDAEGKFADAGGAAGARGGGAGGGEEGGGSEAEAVEFHGDTAEAYDKAEQYCERSSGSWQDQLTDDEADAVEDYTTQDNEVVNAVLRGQEPPKVRGEDAHEKAKALTEKLDNAIAKSHLTADHVAYRGAVLPQDMPLEVGSSFVDNGYTSVSLMEGTARTYIPNAKRLPTGMRPVLMRVSLAKGTKAAIPDGLSVSPSETEIIIVRGTRYKITSVKQESPRSPGAAATTVVNVEVIQS